MMITTKKPEVVIVVAEHEVEGRSFDGYRLAEIVYKDRVEVGVESTVDDENGYAGQYGNRTHSVSKPLVLREPRFVMVSGLNDILARKQQEIIELSECISDTEKAKNAAEEAVGVAAKRTTELEREIESINVSLRAARDNNNTLRASNSKLEGDIGKVRTAVGVLRMKEILGE